jgi:putative tryptophan/tyrosine transport system substrate-binding protein
MGNGKRDLRASQFGFERGDPFKIISALEVYHRGFGQDSDSHNETASFFGNGGCMFCPGSGTKQAQPAVRRKAIGGGEMNKRKLGSFALCAMLFALCLPAEAQQPKKIPRIGFLAAPSQSFFSARAEGFRQGLRDLGYIEGKNILIEYRYAEGNQGRLPDLAAELVSLKVDVIVASGAGGLAAKNATHTVPVVFASVPDPVATGLVDSLARPGGNVTGLSNLAPELSGKRLELLKEIVPKIIRVAFLWSSARANISGKTLGGRVTEKETQAAAKALGLQFQSLEVHDSKDFDTVFEAATKNRAQALLTTTSSFLNTRHARIIEFAKKNRLPAMYGEPEFVDAGGLMSYTPNSADLFRRAATYVDKILKGRKPADLPVEQPMKFELVINLKTAKQIGVTIPQSLLYRADRVIK